MSWYFVRIIFLVHWCIGLEKNISAPKNLGTTSLVREQSCVLSIVAT